MIIRSLIVFLGESVQMRFVAIASVCLSVDDDWRRLKRRFELLSRSLIGKWKWHGCCWKASAALTYVSHHYWLLVSSLTSRCTCYI